MPSLPILRFTLNYILSIDAYPLYHWSFLFPHCRPTIPRSFGPVKNLLRAIDSLQHNFQLCSSTLYTCLQLPLIDLLFCQRPADYSLSTLFSPPSTVLQHLTTLRQLKGSDIFCFNTEKIALEFHHNPMPFLIATPVPKPLLSFNQTVFFSTISFYITFSPQYLVKQMHFKLTSTLIQTPPIYQLYTIFFKLLIVIL
jgi:hypothetical protein